MQGGLLVAVVRGANSPKILRTITEQLQHEHKVLDGNAERKEVMINFVNICKNFEMVENTPPKVRLCICTCIGWTN